jgi:hypothetical protein
VFGPIFKGLGIAASPTGRRAIRHAIRLARSTEGKKVIAQARRVAVSPEGRKLIGEAARLATRAGKAAGAPGKRARVRDVGRVLRGHRH